jgi:hypothetical protein
VPIGAVLLVAGLGTSAVLLWRALHAPRSKAG